MSKYLITFSFFILLSSTQSIAGEYWVGNSANCTGNNVFANLNQALFVAGLNGDQVDTIRLTNTVSYTGLTNGRYDLSGFTTGQLSIIGGYSDCFGPRNTITLIGDVSAGSAITIAPGSGASSSFDLVNLDLGQAAESGLVVSGSASVFLDNTSLVNNDHSGLVVNGGGFVELLANSTIRLNNNFSTPTGGGVSCTGNNSTVVIRGSVRFNRAQKGGNLYLANGCYIELEDGARITGRVDGLVEALEGGGIYVDNGGQLFADGRASGVLINDNFAERGGGLFVTGSGSVILQNTFFDGNDGNEGAAISAVNGGGSVTQLIMDKTNQCSTLFDCSVITNSRADDTVVDVENSIIQVSRTVIRNNEKILSAINQVDGIIDTRNDGLIRMNRVAIVENVIYGAISARGGRVEATHLTIARNNDVNTGLPFSIVETAFVDSSISIENSLITDTRGTDIRSALGPLSGRCNLVDNADNFTSVDGFPSGSFDLGIAAFVNANNGDYRQVAGSLGVDMCVQDSFSWSNEVDIEQQVAPVNESTNPQGLPGDSGGIFDVGVDEVYDNIGQDEFLFTVVKKGSGSGSVISQPGGISCGTDCSEVYFNGTVVTLFAVAEPGSVFSQWLNCPLVNEDDECLAAVTSNLTVRAVFESDDLIFENDFE